MVYTRAEASRLLLEAEGLARAGKLLLAEAAYQQLLSRFADLADAWYNLALLQRRLGRFEMALASYQQALDRGVAAPEEAHLNRGVIYSDHLRQHAAAEIELRAALRINPDYQPALMNLANLCEDLGRRSEARTAYETLLALDPANCEVLARYANLHSFSTEHDPLLARLRSALLRPGTSAADKASLGFALGRALDSASSYAEAFKEYSAANGYSRLSATGSRAPYDRKAHEQHVDRIMQAFRSPVVQTGPPASTLQPIFICGMFRSGSTLLEQVLGRHPDITVGGELPFLPRLVRSKLAEYPAGLPTVPPGVLEQLAAQYSGAVHEMFPAAQRVTDKRPDNFLYIGLIKRMFPRARILHSRRNALDNCLSIFFLHLDHSMTYAFDLMDIAHYYLQYQRLMAHWKSVYALDIFDFDYDEFVHEPRPAVEQLLSFLGLGWNEECLHFENAGHSVKTASVWQVREQLYQHSSGRWRNYAGQIADLRQYLELPPVSRPGVASVAPIQAGQ